MRGFWDVETGKMDRTLKSGSAEPVGDLFAFSVVKRTASAAGPPNFYITQKICSGLK